MTCLTFSLRIIIIRCPINGYNWRTSKVAAKRFNCRAEEGPRHRVVLRVLLKPPGSHINPQQTRRREGRGGRGRGRGRHVALGRLNLHQGSLLVPDPSLLSIIYLPWKYGAQYGREQTVCSTSSVCVCHMVAWTPHTHAAFNRLGASGSQVRTCVCVCVYWFSLWAQTVSLVYERFKQTAGKWKWRTELWLNFEGQLCDFSMEVTRLSLQFVLDKG